MGGNLMKIHIDAACQASNGPCKAKCDGSTTRDANTSEYREKLECLFLLS